MNAVKENSYAEAPIFALGGEYLGKYGQRMRNFGVSLHGFVNWYLQEYPECTRQGCGAFYFYVSSSEQDCSPPAIAGKLFFKSCFLKKTENQEFTWETGWELTSAGIHLMRLRLGESTWKRFWREKIESWSARAVCAK